MDTDTQPDENLIGTADDKHHHGSVVADFVDGNLTTLSVQGMNSFQLFGLAELIRVQGMQMYTIERAAAKAEQETGIVVPPAGLRVRN